MKLCLPLEKIQPDQTQQFGGKTTALARLVAENYNVPLSLGISTTAYRHYLSETNLQSRILMELGRKDLADMRWEEIWDAALRIRNLFLTTPVPNTLSTLLIDHLKTVFQDQPVVVRSSAPAEDSAATSFAGLHESCVNVRGPESFLLAIRKVWASLWSDRAILYRKELGLDLKTSAMAVLVQELVSGEKSGVAFSRSPTNPDSQAIEAVWGLNQGLVDGSVEPDFWELSRSDHRILNFKPAQRKIRLIPKVDDVKAVSLNRSQRNTAPLKDNEVLKVSSLVMQLEQLLGQPQDVEWTWHGDELVLLQSRPITTEPAADSAADQRGWYLSLHRSLENLKSLRKRIETEIIPGMEKDAQETAAINLAGLDNHALAGEIRRQRELSAKWNQQYKRYCIPMAHGIRLFGEFYNDALKPENPFEFVQLLQGEKLKALERNSQLRLLAEEIGNDPEILQAAENSFDQLPIKIHQQLHHLADAMGLEMRQILQLSVEMARKNSLRPREKNHDALEQAYLEHFPLDVRPKAQELLELGRASQRLRDDDNISLDKIRRELSRTEAAAEQRIKEQRGEELKTLFAGDRQRGLNKSTSQQPPLPDSALRTPLGPIRTRQLQGQPASPGIVTAPARVIWNSNELASFRSGEILICDAIDPAMTFIVPLAAGIVERRGGMLIHGAIIAREYGIPCVTGIPDAASIIRSGDQLTVDGYLGLVIISQK